MKKVLVLYYSRSGNTEKMANAVAEGAKNVSDIQVELNFHIETGELRNYDAVLVGVPTYRKEMPIDFKNLFENAASEGISLKGKVGAVFGSYGWSGEAPKQAIDLLQKLGAEVIEPAIMAKYIPDAAALDACKSLGRKVAETLKNQA